MGAAHLNTPLAPVEYGINHQLAGVLDDPATGVLPALVSRSIDRCAEIGRVCPAPDLQTMTVLHATFHPIGNGSRSGAYASLVSRECRAVAEMVACRMVYIDLLVDIDFIEEYSAALYIPGKEELFPTHFKKTV